MNQQLTHEHELSGGEMGELHIVENEVPTHIHAETSHETVFEEENVEELTEVLEENDMEEIKQDKQKTDTEEAS